MESHPTKGSALVGGENFATSVQSQDQPQSQQFLWRAPSKLDGGHLVYLDDSIVVREAPKSTQYPLSDSQSWQVMADQTEDKKVARDELLAEQLVPVPVQVLFLDQTSDKSRKHLSSKICCCSNVIISRSPLVTTHTGQPSCFLKLNCQFHCYCHCQA